jgi:PAS domain S-box-containing protein
VNAAVLVVLMVGGLLVGATWWTLALIERTLMLPTPEQVLDGKRPFGVTLLPWRRVLRAILAETERLKQSEFDHQTRYKILTDNVAAAVIIHQPDGTVLWCSPYAEVLTGFSLSEVYRNRETFMMRHVHEDDRDMVEKSMAIVATGEPFQCRYRFYHKSGMMLWLETRTVPVFDHVADEYVALSITLDVTATVLSQMKIEERNRDLNEFTYMISHDLKAPIVTMRGMLDVLQEEQKRLDAADMVEPLHFMSKAIHRLEQLVGGVLELARVSAADRALEPVQIADVAREVLDDLQLDIGRCAAQVAMASDLPCVLGNKTQLYQILSNIIANAIKYRQQERPLVLSIDATSATSRRRVSFSIRDNGRGIAPERIEHIFEPFNRAGEESIEGSGIGLACVKKLVEKLGGTIAVRSVPEQGSEFTIELRRAPETESLR